MVVIQNLLQRLGKIGKALVRSAEMITQGLEFGAGKACELIQYVSEKEKGKLLSRESSGEQQGKDRFSANLKSINIQQYQINVK